MHRGIAGVLAGVLLAFGLFLWACRSREPRAQPAADSVEAALRAGDNLAVVRACERYLESRGAPDPDPQRTEYIRNVYSRAFVSWFLSVRVHDTEALRHAERYRSLNGSKPR